jgi:glycosyltransferase involved in cell wall biosynthesis
MRIAVFTPYLKPGALGRTIPEVFKRFVDQGHEVHLYTGEISADIQATLERWRITPHITKLPLNDRLFLLNSIITGLRFKEKSDVLVAWEFPSNIAAALAKLRTGAPLVWFCQEPSKLLYEPETLSYIKKWRPFHIYLISLALNRCLRVIDQWAVSKADVILANSEYTAECVWHAYGRRARVVHTSFDYRPFASKAPVEAVREKFKIPSRARILFCPGRLYPQKRVDIAIETLKILSEKHDSLMLVISGSGPDEQKLRGLAETLGVSEKVRFVGVVSLPELVALYKLCEIVLYPTINEPWGFVALEAMVCGKPVVAFKCGGPAESVVDGKTGLLVKEIGSVEAFSQAVDFLLEHPKKAREMGAKGKERSKLFSIEKTVEGLSEAIEKCLKDRGRN